MPEREQSRKHHEDDTGRREDFGRQNHIGRGCRPKAKHVLPHAPRLPDVICAEKHPAKQHDDLRQENLHHTRGLVVPGVLVVRAFRNHKEGMVKPPANERPVRTVPDTACEHDQEQVQVQTLDADAVSAQRNVKVVA